MKNKFYILIIILGSFISVQAQSKKNYFPIWTYHQKNINIHGISIGGWTLGNQMRNTNTNGIKIELIGVGFAMPLIPESPVSQTESEFKSRMMEKVSERINGLSLSATGASCNCFINGISTGLVGQINTKVNGISAVLFMNFSDVSNGLQIAIIGNESYISNGLQIGGYNLGHKHSGVQIGVVNKSDELYGIQIGLWNINQKRRLPIINWNFRKRKTTSANTGSAVMP